MRGSAIVGSTDGGLTWTQYPETEDIPRVYGFFQLGGTLFAAPEVRAGLAAPTS